MPIPAIQFEIDQLKAVSTRLGSLADQHPPVEREIMSISGNVLSSAVLLEVLLATRLRPTWESSRIYRNRPVGILPKLRISNVSADMWSADLPAARAFHSPWS